LIYQQDSNREKTYRREKGAPLSPTSALAAQNKIAIADVLTQELRKAFGKYSSVDLLSPENPSSLRGR